MKCGKVRELFSSHLESAMDGRQSAEFEEHLAGCADCRAAYERVNATVMMLEEMPEVEPPADFHATVMARVQEARRAAPQPVRWWAIDWQRVFTIRVPARAAALGIAAVLLAAMLVQFTPLGVGIANILGVGKQGPQQQITTNDQDNPRQWGPWTPKPKTQAGLQITIRMEDANTYAVSLGAASNDAIAYTLSVDGDSYSRKVQANEKWVVTMPAPKSGVTVAKVVWRFQDLNREAQIFLPAKISRKEMPKSVALDATDVQSLLQRLAQEYGIAIIASGYLQAKVPGGQIEDSSAGDALYYFLEGSGMKMTALSQSVYAVEPIR